ncbi:serine hydrolase domain-containing protein [Stackebrandtia nassauensis]|uniref:Beta-lactamase n=1 Tax=Stackebrandtia nassauensis (strain DSM 44728 / CIP 108903 / NRRL B-16338 / NBRC 102104 / LLR-40K-21) TaxID=446470 RepID=D3PV20_STANL|nr:serine hydrolase [Stackebrandtia nassauensis]ADD41073.1 beta-lactamase [Stackebrandtia nassauensis DSM 44728]
MKRRSLFSGAALVAGSPILLGMPQAAAAFDPSGFEGTAGPPTITPEDLRFRPRRLRPGSAHSAGLLKEYVDRIVPDTAAFMKPGGPERPRPSHPGFVVLAARDGVIVTHEAGGHALRYASYDGATDTAVELPDADKVAMTKDTIFDVASMSKLFTSMVATQLAASGDLDLDATVAGYLPEFAAVDPAKAPITVKQLLTHISGMRSWLPLYAEPDNPSRLRAIYKSPLRREPGSGYEYSDLNLITLSAIIESITGSTLDVEVAERITKPLGLSDTGYNPAASEVHRIAATEFQPGLGRGMIRGRVHDENAWSFGGVAGHAGVFSTARDIAIFAQTILNGGSYGSTRLLSRDWVRALLTNYNTSFPPEAGRGLGWQIDQRFYMDGLSSPVSAGHTGFTGTCVVIDPIAGSLYVLLTNRVHPTRNWGTDSVYRRAGARDLARAVAVRPRHREAWYAPAVPASLSLGFDEPLDATTASFALWYDTDPTALVELQSSTDGEQWTKVELKLSADGHDWVSDSLSGFEGRQWLSVRAKLPSGTTGLRWHHNGGDGSRRGRGVYVDKVRLRRDGDTIFDSERPSDAARFQPEGWTLSRD